MNFMTLIKPAVFVMVVFSWIFYAMTAMAEVSSNANPSTPAVNTPIVTTTPDAAQDWSLSAEEWNQYQALMQGPDGLWYQKLTPAMVLGMRAKSVEEQQHFARIVAEQEHDKVARELAFNNAVFAAMRQLYPDEPMIKAFDQTPFNPAAKAMPLSVESKVK